MSPAALRAAVWVAVADFVVLAAVVVFVAWLVFR